MEELRIKHFTTLSYLPINITNIDEEVDIDALTASVTKKIGKNRGEKVAPEDIPAVCALELEYENRLNDF